MKIIFVDLNKKLVDEVKKVFKDKKNNPWNAELIATKGDIFKAQKKYGGRIVTASNPLFEMQGGLDLAISKKFPDEIRYCGEFNKTENLFFSITVDRNRNASKEQVFRALAGTFLKNFKDTVLISGLGTGIGGLAIETFIDVLKTILDANLSSANLRYANLSSANLRYADLSSADLSSANLSSADLRYADLSSADLSDADLSDVNLSSANLSSANLSSANLRYANLSSANLSYANLRYADLSSADLSSANLSSANLRSANLSYANLSSADLSSADLRITEFDGLTVRQMIEKYNLKIDKKGDVILYKRVNGDESPNIGNLKYKKGQIIEDLYVNFRVYDTCAHGLHVFLLKDMADSWDWGDRTIRVKVNVMDFVAIPASGEGKVRVKRLEVMD